MKLSSGSPSGICDSSELGRSAGEPCRPLLLGHRGVREQAGLRRGARKTSAPAENTLAAFQYALDHGCDGFEFDIRLTRDARLVVCHNAWARGYRISALPFDKLCSRCRAEVPCLEDVLQEFADRAYLDIEVKVAGAEEAIVKLLQRTPPRSYLVSSFLPQVLLRFHELDPSVPLGLVCNRDSNLWIWRELPIQVFLPHHKLVTQELIQQLRGRGVRVMSWTVNLESEIRQLGAWGIDGLISDDPRLLSRMFQVPDPPP